MNEKQEIEIKLLEEKSSFYKKFKKAENELLMLRKSHQQLMEIKFKEYMAFSTSQLNFSFD